MNSCQPIMPLSLKICFQTVTGSDAKITDEFCIFIILESLIYAVKICFRKRDCAWPWQLFYSDVRNAFLVYCHICLWNRKTFIAEACALVYPGYDEYAIKALTLELEFQRLIGYHMVQTYIPSFLIVSLTWFSFYLGLDAIPGRVTLLVTSLLTLVTLFGGIKNDLPHVAYIKVIGKKCYI